MNTKSPLPICSPVLSKKLKQLFNQATFAFDFLLLLIFDINPIGKNQKPWMQRFRYTEDHLWIEIPFDELGVLLSGQHRQYTNPFLITNWISDSRGFRLKKNTIKNGDGRMNPRITGIIKFKNEKKNIMASEGIICKGNFGCDLRMGKCKVGMKLKYLQNHHVKVYVKENNHGINFQLNYAKFKIPHFIRQKIRDSDTEKKKLGAVGTTASEEYLRISLTLPDQSPRTLSLLPTPKCIDNILYYNRRASSKLDEIQRVDEFIKTSIHNLPSISR